MKSDISATVHDMISKVREELLLHALPTISRKVHSNTMLLLLKSGVEVAGIWKLRIERK